MIAGWWHRALAWWIVRRSPRASVYELHVSAGDLVVVEMDDLLSYEGVERVASQFHHVMPNVKVIVMMRARVAGVIHADGVGGSNL